MTRRARGITAGLTLIALGLGIYYLREYVEGLGRGWILVLIGGVFCAAYFYSRNSGYLIPGCITLSLGLGSIGERTFFSADRSNAVPLGLGFLAIYVIQLAYERRAHWWPLIPGGALVLLGIDSMRRWVRLAFENWPILLVVIGVLVVISALLGGEETTEPTERLDGSEP